MNYNHDGIEYVEIHDYAAMIQRSVQAVRTSIFTGNRVRKLKYRREGRRLFIPLSEYYIYPYINSGKGKDRVYHYPGPTLCEACTAGKRCTKINEEGEWNGDEACTV